jgi:membrane protein YqaA with SNARE-associated domain
MTATAAERRGRRTTNRLRRRLLHIIAVLYRWAESGWSRSAVAIWGLLQGSVVPGPSDTLLVPLGLADPPRVFQLAAWATAGSLVGGLLAYGIGALACGELAPTLLPALGVTAAELASLRADVADHGWILVLTSSLPVVGSAKLVSLAAGAFGMPLWQFALALFATRAARFFVVAALVRFAGSGVTDWVQRTIGRPVAAIK